MTVAPGGFADALERAFVELPAGSARARLTHYCGRLWDLLRSSDLLEPERESSGSVARVREAAALLEPSAAAIAALVTEGVAAGEFGAVSPRGVARLLLSSLFGRAQWCSRGVDPLLCGSCARAAVETLDLLWPALHVDPAGQSRRPPSDPDPAGATPEAVPKLPPPKEAS